MVIKNSYHILSLGCAKNTVDSESMSLIMARAGYRRLDEPDQAQFIIVNTCGFIRPAQDESLHLLQQLAEGKRKNQYLIAAGCLSERLKEGLLSQNSGIDGVFGTRRWMDILRVIQKIRSLSAGEGPYVYFPNQLIDEDQTGDVPRVAIQGASAYLKIADGCRHRCAFCAIPVIKGPQQSRPIEKIVEDALLLQEQGVQEINLIAQDSTGYGLDLGMTDGLSLLLEKLLPVVPDVPWIRILYAFPGSVSPRLIDLMAESKQILPYIDIPLQHADPDILRAMHRPVNMDWVYSTLQVLRNRIPGIALRSTFIVGYPGETEEKFQVLLDFLREVQLDHVGAFTYSFEPGTPGESLGDPIPENVKAERLERLMLQQEQISEARNQQMVGKTLPVLIEGIGDGISVGRSYRDAPEIDGLVFIDQSLNEGEIVPVKVTRAMVHDLLASVETPKRKSSK